MVACFILRTPRKMISPQPGDFYRIICYICGMENNNDISGDLRDLAEKNPCIKFVIDNYGLLCRAHRGKIVLVLEHEYDFLSVPAYVSRTFDSMIEAVQLMNALRMSNVPYALKECNGGEITDNLFFSPACRTRS